MYRDQYESESYNYRTGGVDNRLCPSDRCAYVASQRYVLQTQKIHTVSQGRVQVEEHVATRM